VFPKESYKPGDLVTVTVHDATAATLLGRAVVQVNTLGATPGGH